MKEKIFVQCEAGGKSGEGQLALKLWTPEEQKKRALKTWAVGWGIAVASVFLPLVHFFLVPLFLFGTPFVARQVQKQAGVIEGIEGPCPFCGKSLDRPLNLTMSFPLRLPCSACFEVVKIERKA